MAYVILNLVCVAALVGIDQVIKLWAVQALAPVESITLIPHVLELRFALNQGMAFSNLIDRVLNGEVVDYINPLFIDFAVFNFADICVCVGVALWVLVILLEEVDDKPSKER